jgi:hypothetical protein
MYVKAVLHHWLALSSGHKLQTVNYHDVRANLWRDTH